MTFSKRTFAKDRPMAKAKAASKIQKFIKARYNNVAMNRMPELKYAVQSAPFAQVQSSAGTPLILLLNGTTQGVTNNAQRVGNKIVTKQIYYKFSASNSLTELGAVAAITNATWINVAIVYDKQVNGSAPVYGDIYKVAGNASDPFSLPNLDNQDRFTILSQDTIALCSGGPNASQPITRFLKTRLETKYGGTGSSVANIITGAIYLVAVGCFSAAPAVSLGYSVRLLYDDE